MLQINWTVLTYFIIGLFILNGFYRGWWKEAITTFGLGILVALLRSPQTAQSVINIINYIVVTIMELMPNSVLILLSDIFNEDFLAESAASYQIDASQRGNWLFILLVILMITIFIGNRGGHGYTADRSGSFLGGLVGGLNGFIFMNLVREYLDGRNLPGIGPEIAGGSASSGVDIRAMNVPSYTIMDSVVPWIIILVALAIFVVAMRNRVKYDAGGKGFKKFKTIDPTFYNKA